MKYYEDTRGPMYRQNGWHEFITDERRKDILLERPPAPHVASENELDTLFRFSYQESEPLMKLTQSIALMLSYMFSVPMPIKLGYKFPEETVKAINSQLHRHKMDHLTDGYIRQSDLILLSNSPKCPYKLSVNGTLDGDGNSILFIVFILKKDITVNTSERKPIEI